MQCRVCQRFEDGNLRCVGGLKGQHAQPCHPQQRPADPNQSMDALRGLRVEGQMGGLPDKQIKPQAAHRQRHTEQIKPADERIGRWHCFGFCFWQGGACGGSRADHQRKTALSGVAIGGGYHPPFNRVRALCHPADGGIHLFGVCRVHHAGNARHRVTLLVVNDHAAEFRLQRLGKPEADFVRWRRQHAVGGRVRLRQVGMRTGRADRH